MNSMKQDIAYLGAKIEETNSNVKTILEIVVPMQQDVAQLKEDMVEVKQDIVEIKADIQTIKKVLKVTNEQVDNHEHRITRLETKPA